MIATPRPPGLAPRVALVRSRYDPAGGAERFVQNAMAALRSQGAVITVVTREWPGDDGSAIVVDPFHVGSLWRDRAFASAACREIGRRHFDLVQSHERIPCCDIYRAGDGVHAQWLHERARAQGILARLATRLSPHHRHLLAAERALFASPRLRAVICNSEMVRAEIAARFGLGEERLVLIRNAVDSRNFAPAATGAQREAMRQQLGIPQDARVVLHVGSGFERKGVATLLRAAARAEAAPWVVVVGRDKRAARYRSLAASLGIASRCRFAGSASDVLPFYQMADIFMLATLYDPQPNAVLEAMACALPVVTTTKCGAAELLREGESGYVRDALDVEGLAAAIDRLDAHHAGEAGRRAREAVLPYTPAAMAEAYLALYRRLLHR